MEATRAGRWELDQLLLDVRISIGLIVDGLAEIDTLSSDTSFSHSASGVPLGEGRLLCLFLFAKTHHLVQKSVLLFLRSLHTLSGPSSSSNFIVSFRNLLFGGLVEGVDAGVLGDGLGSFLTDISHGLVVLDGAEESVMDAADVNIWRVWILDKTIARRIIHLKVEGEIAAFSHSFKLADELVDLGSNLRVELATIFLELFDSLNS